ncbi:MAG: NAD(+) diphosphatase [Eubacteriales bacterium]|nr:NAD(+) diphosphatase [Eubacteriales bacterium]
MILGETSFSVQPGRRAPEDASLYFCFQQGRILLGEKAGKPTLPTYAMVKPLLPEGVNAFELAHTESKSIFCPDPMGEVTVPEGDGLRYQAIGTFHSMDFADGSLLTSAYHLWNWYRRNRFCGVCGHGLQPCETERALRCPECGELFFPMIAPAVIVAITCGDSILLARNVRSEANHYALVAGYVEVGETIEHAVRREVWEEVGLELGAIRYIGDQPWGVSGSLMFAFHAEADCNAPITLQASEIADAKWVRREELAVTERPVSIAFELIERFRTGRL